jgi:hypothetical protein
MALSGLAATAETVGCGPADVRKTCAHLEEITQKITQLAADLRVDDALNALREMDKYPLSPDGARARLEIAGALRRQGRFTEAVALLEKTAKDDPFNRVAPESLALLASVLRSDLKDDNRYRQYLLDLATKYYPGIPAVAEARAAYGEQPPEVPTQRKILLDHSVKEASIFSRCFMGDCNFGQWDVLRTLSTAGYVVHANQGCEPAEFTPKVMSQYGLIIMNLCDSRAADPISEQLATDLAGYVRDGGSLLVISAGTTLGGGKCARFYNPLMARFGFAFKEGATTGGSTKQGHFADHPAVQGLAGFDYVFGTPVIGGTVLASDGSQPLMAVTAFGKGKVIAAGIGCAFCGNTMGDIYRFTPEQKARTLPNKAFLTKLVSYLLATADRSLSPSTAAKVATTTPMVVPATPSGMSAFNDPKPFTVVANPRPQLQSSILNQNTFVLTWTSVPGQTYRVQYKDSLDASQWSDLTNVIATGTSTSVGDPMSTSDRFYRILLLEQRNANGD